MSICFMILLGFVDDVLDARWSVKIFLSFLATTPLLVAYNGPTTIIVPKPLRGSWFADIITFNSSLHLGNVALRVIAIRMSPKYSYQLHDHPPSRATHYFDHHSFFIFYRQSHSHVLFPDFNICLQVLCTTCTCYLFLYLAPTRSIFWLVSMG